MGIRRQEMNRNRIMDGACLLLNEGQYGALTVDALARALHMSKSTLYKYFTGKQALVVSVVERACQETEQDAAEFRDWEPGQPAVKALEAVLVVYGTHGTRLPTAFVLEHHKLPRVAQRRLAAVRAELDGLCGIVIEQGVRDDAFRYKRADLLATAVQASVAAAVEAGARGELETDVRSSVQSLLPLFV